MAAGLEPAAWRRRWTTLAAATGLNSAPSPACRRLRDKHAPTWRRAGIDSRSEAGAALGAALAHRAPLRLLLGIYLRPDGRHLSRRRGRAAGLLPDRHGGDPGGGRRCGARPPRPASSPRPTRLFTACVRAQRRRASASASRPPSPGRMASSTFHTLAVRARTGRRRGGAEGDRPRRRDPDLRPAGLARMKKGGPRTAPSVGVCRGRLLLLEHALDLGLAGVDRGRAARDGEGRRCPRRRCRPPS